MSGVMIKSVYRCLSALVVLTGGLAVSVSAMPIAAGHSSARPDLKSAVPAARPLIRIAGENASDPSRRTAIGNKVTRGERQRRERLRRERARRARLKKERIVETIAGMGELSNLVKTRDLVRNRLKRLRQKQLDGETLSSEESSQADRLERELSDMHGTVGALQTQKESVSTRIKKLKDSGAARALSDAESRDLRTAETELAEIERQALNQAEQSRRLRNRMSRLIKLRQSRDLDSNEKAELNDARTELDTIDGKLSAKAFAVVEVIDAIGNGPNGIDPTHPLMQDMIPIEPDGVFVSDQGDDATCGYHACIMVAESRNRLTSMSKLEQILPVKRDASGEAVGTTANEVRGILDGLDLAAKVTKDFSKLSAGVRSNALANFVKKKKVSMVVGINSSQSFKELNFQQGNSNAPESLKQASRYANSRANYPHWVVVDGVVNVNVSDNSQPKWEEHFVIRDPQGLTYTHPVSTFDRGFDGEVVYPTK